MQLPDKPAAEADPTRLSATRGHRLAGPGEVSGSRRRLNLTSDVDTGPARVGAGPGLGRPGHPGT